MTLDQQIGLCALCEIDRRNLGVYQLRSDLIIIIIIKPEVLTGLHRFWNL